MNAILVTAIGLLILLIIVYILSKTINFYEEKLKKKYRSLGCMTLGRLSNTDVPSVEIKKFLKLTNVF